jgi:hypothetical protein
MAALETIADLLRRERNKLIAYQARIEKAESSPHHRGQAPSTEMRLAKGREGPGNSSGPYRRSGTAGTRYPLPEYAILLRE